MEDLFGNGADNLLIEIVDERFLRIKYNFDRAMRIKVWRPF